MHSKPRLVCLPSLIPNYLHIPAVQGAIATCARAVGCTLERSYVKGCRVSLTPTLVVIGYDILAHVILLKRRQGVTFLTAQRQRQGTHRYGGMEGGMRDRIDGDRKNTNEGKGQKSRGK